MRDSGGQFLPGIAAIGEETAQGRIGVATAFDEVRCAVAVLDVSGEHQSVEEVAGRVGRDMALAALDLLAGIIAARPTRFGGLDRLAVDDARRRFCLAPFGNPYSGYPPRVYRLEPAPVAHPARKRFVAGKSGT